MSDPAELDAGNGQDTGGVLEGVPGPVDQVGFDAVHETPPDAFDGAPEQDDDRGGNEEADDRVGEWEAEQHTDGAEDDGQRSEPVQACVDAVGDQGG